MDRVIDRTEQEKEGKGSICGGRSGASSEETSKEDPVP